ncbi:hypothetical protein [Flavobacterium sp.]|uniref:hypothetical protein n=1 Tax=Flavobacterium sp. TaxID=239 RepID=UPI00391AF8B8
MKKMSLTFSFLVISINCFSQMLLHNDNDISHPLVVYSTMSNNPTPAVNSPKVYNIYFHILTEEGGSSNVGEAQVMDAVKNLNVAYNQFYIFFKYRGFDNIYSNEHINIRTPGNTISPLLPTQDDLHSFSLQNNHQVDNAINIFVVHNFLQIDNGIETVLPGYVSYILNPNVGHNMPNIFIPEAFFTTGVLVHEMGHIFGARHTNENGVGLTPINSSVCERVTRDPDNINSYSGFNADSAGDGNVDTYASPFEYEDADVDENGVYIGHQRDCSGFNGYDSNGNNLPYLPGVLYVTYPVPIKNFMNVNRIEDIQFQGEFTFNQGERFRNYVEDPINSQLALFATTVESLYEPFETTNIGGNAIISVEDLGNGYATVCRNLLEKHRFQKGFDYIFPENDGDPDLINVNINNIPVDINHSLDYPIIINQIDPTQIGTVTVVCTRGVICTEEEFVSGTDLITDFIGSYNFTIEQWDKLKVNDPNLYDYLQAHKYHIIKKVTETGVLYEVVVYKE